MYIGVDVGGMSVKAGIVDDSGKILYKDSVPSGALRPQHEIVADMGKLLKNLISNSDIDEKEIKSIGIGLPGACNSDEGKVILCNNININNCYLSNEIRKYINIPVFLQNDANCAALAEYYNIGQKLKCFITVTLGTGIGGGIIIDDKIFSGFNGAGGEVGHMVIKDGMSVCNCGRSGCWENFASVTALISQTKSAMQKDSKSLMHKISNGNITGKTAFDAAKQGDKTAIDVVNKYFSYVATGITNLINIFQPDMIVIGGAISKEGDYLLNPIKDICLSKCYAAGLCENTKFKIASLGNDAGIIGAAMLGK